MLSQVEIELVANYLVSIKKLLTLVGIFGLAPIDSSRRSSSTLLFIQAYVSVVAPHYIE